MKTLALVLLFTLLTSFTTNVETQEVKDTETTTVIICTGKYAKCYHNSKCRGVKACKAELKKVSISSAKKSGYRACKYCYK